MKICLFLLFVFLVSAQLSHGASDSFKYYTAGLLSKTQQQQLGVRLEWVKLPPKQVKAGESFTVRWRLHSGKLTYIDHLNLHACPQRYGRICSKGENRQDGAVISGKPQEYYAQTFAFKKGTTPGKYILSGHLQTGKAEILTTQGADLKAYSVIITVVK